MMPSKISKASMSFTRTQPSSSISAPTFLAPCRKIQDIFLDIAVRSSSLGFSDIICSKVRLSFSLAAFTLTCGTIGSGSAASLLTDQTVVHVESSCPTTSCDNEVTGGFVSTNGVNGDVAATLGSAACSSPRCSSAASSARASTDSATSAAVVAASAAASAAVSPATVTSAASSGSAGGNSVTGAGLLRDSSPASAPREASAGT
mmetsp:Transcript_92513/g.160728  ORF Transcript_92513/g.160728 Transcript_92513/m.160728 type:complete len:204 (-) Transcript_92513:234-845(-)